MSLTWVPLNIVSSFTSDSTSTAKEDPAASSEPGPGCREAWLTLTSVKYRGNSAIRFDTY